MKAGFVSVVLTTGSSAKEAYGLLRASFEDGSFFPDGGIPWLSSQGKPSPHAPLGCLALPARRVILTNL